MKIVFASYREWSNKIADMLKKDSHDILHVQKPEDLTLATVDKFKPQLFFIAGWSWYIPLELFNKYCIIGLHPSMLPKYRGGSPLQNQIIAGEQKSGVSLFKITEKFDEGPLYGQEEISLAGHLDEIYDRITQVGIKLFKKVISDYPNLKCWEQDHSKATFFKRRKPEQSELKIEELKTMTGEQLYNFIRAIEDPYPNAFIRCSDGKKLLIKRAELEQ